MSRQQIHPYLDPDLYRKLDAYVAAKDTTITAVVAAALQDYFDDKNDTALILRRLDRVDRADYRLQRDIDVLSQAFAVFIQLWSSYLPELRDGGDAAKRMAESRFASFVDLVAQQFVAGRRLVDLVTKDPVGNQAELAAAASQPVENQL
jgi:hypothetical protein